MLRIINVDESLVAILEANPCRSVGVLDMRGYIGLAFEKDGQFYRLL